MTQKHYSVLFYCKSFVSIHETVSFIWHSYARNLFRNLSGTFLSLRNYSILTHFLKTLGTLGMFQPQEPLVWFPDTFLGTFPGAFPESRPFFSGICLQILYCTMFNLRLFLGLVLRFMSLWPKIKIHFYLTPTFSGSQSLYQELKNFSVGLFPVHRPF